MRLARWSLLSSRELWYAWCQECMAQHFTLLQAEAYAIWTGNRLVKAAQRSTRNRFYEAKDAWLRRVAWSLVDGQVTRVETRLCYDCGGKGEDCERCDGSGVWSMRTLYLHILDIDGERFAFHSYTTPALLSCTQGEDAEAFGTPFTDAERASLLLPLSGIVKMLRWAMFHGWSEAVTLVGPHTITPVVRCHCTAWPGDRRGGHHVLCRKRI